MNTRKIIISFLTLAFVGMASAEDLSPWLTLNSKKTKINDMLSTKSHVELRFPEFDSLSYYRVSQKFYVPVGGDWTLGAHPVFENSKKGDDWNSTYRLDMELNPKKFKLGDNGPTLGMRNRWELRWKEGKGSEIFHRFRQQSKLTWKLEGGPFTSYSVGNEVFFEEDKGKITANRFYPIALGANAGPAKSSYYLMYQSKRSGTTSEWNGEYILGASYSF